jgi:hypothetical protein
MATDVCKDMQFALDTIEELMDNVDTFAEAVRATLCLPIPAPTGEEDTGEYAGKVAEELARQINLHKAFTVQDKT